MKSCNFRRSLLSAVSGAVLIAVSASAIAKDKEKDKPFKASIEFVETLSGGFSAECPLAGTIIGSGQATHLGRFTLISFDCIKPDAYPATFPSTFKTQEDTTGLKAVLTAANGDQLFITYSGTAKQPGSVPILDLSGSFTVVGGTGRFAEATSKNGILIGTEELGVGIPPFKGSISLSGLISY